MRRLRVGVLDLIGNRPTPGLWNRLMKPNFASIMPQVIAVWCEQLGHDVRFLCHTGTEDLAARAACRSRRAVHRDLHERGPEGRRDQRPATARPAR